MVCAGGDVERGRREVGAPCHRDCVGRGAGVTIGQSET